MDMQTIFVYTFVIATIGFNSDAQQIYKNQIQVASKPAPNDYVRLSEIPFANAVRAISTPPRDYVPIHEQQQDNSPPPRPQSLPNQPAPAYNPYNQPQMYTNVDPITLGYNTQTPVQQMPNTPMSFQYMTTNDYPNQFYNLLYHTASGNNVQQGNNAQQGNIAQLQVNQGTNGYLQGNTRYQQENINVQGSTGYQQENNVKLQSNNGYLQGNTGYPQENNVKLQNNNGYLQGNTGYQQGNNDNLQGSTGYQQENNVYLQGNTRYQSGNNVNLQGTNGYLQGNTGFQQGNNKYLQGHNYLQQTYNPLSAYQTPVTYMPAMNNNIQAVLAQRIKQAPVYNNYQSSNGYNNFRPSAIDISNYQNQIPTHRFRTGKSVALALPSNNVQYVSNIQGTSGFVPSTMYQYVSERSPRMTPVNYGHGYTSPNSKYIIGGIEYLNLM